jgi:uncharacterized protein (TIGR02646 family)
MIQIIKPAAPARLIEDGGDQTDMDCDEFDRYPHDYRTGVKKFTALGEIYNSPEVKAILMAAHNNKCCYCERCFEDPAYLHVEHYRPKGAVKQNRNEHRKFPGYYWLTYDWDNLFLSCHACNCSNKGDLFPLVDSTLRDARGLSHHYDTSQEEPLFVNPGSDDPREHIRFKGDAPYHRTERGRVTIKELRLDSHRSIIKARLEKIAILDKARRVVESSKKNPENTELAAVAEEFREYLTAAILPSAALSSMAQDYLEDYFENS